MDYIDYQKYKCKCGHETSSYQDLGDYECPECVDERLGRLKVLTIKVDTKTIHYQFRGEEEGMKKAAKGINQIYKQFLIK